jgi:hypothetical protein
MVTFRHEKLVKKIFLKTCRLIAMKKLVEICVHFSLICIVSTGNCFSETRPQHPLRLFAFVNGQNRLIARVTGQKTLTSSRDVHLEHHRSGAFQKRLACFHRSEPFLSLTKARHYTLCFGLGYVGQSGREVIPHNLDVQNMEIPIILKSNGLLVVDKPWGVRMDGDFEVI